MLLEECISRVQEPSLKGPMDVPSVLKMEHSKRRCCLQLGVDADRTSHTCASCGTSWTLSMGPKPTKYYAPQLGGAYLSQLLFHCFVSFPNEHKYERHSAAKKSRMRAMTRAVGEKENNSNYHLLDDPWADDDEMSVATSMTSGEMVRMTLLRGSMPHPVGLMSCLITRRACVKHENPQTGQTGRS
ncbi:hypothetical protein SCLCIDRAFT_1225502 [Scleroderma citrinum Foug A]|uniref:Uncharacterized protein n=1 Tax=Scleroderma citrinum Foug A TaxID=1036808 RepID=A0A0C3D1Q6_9AGAM|nr:hypothetical protein SCLCIDRAFT_1225502 [Scleroderma citrinum Foug A]